MAFAFPAKRRRRKRKPADVGDDAPEPATD